MNKELVSVDGVKKVLKINSFRELSKDKIMEFISLIPNMSKEVAIKIIEQYPAFAKLSEAMILQLNKMCEIALEKNENSQSEVIRAYQKVLDELINQMNTENISEEEKRRISIQIVEICDKISVKDIENRAFIDKVIKYGAGFSIAVVAIGAAILGVNVKGKDIY